MYKPQLGNLWRFQRWPKPEALSALNFTRFCTLVSSSITHNQTLKSQPISQFRCGKEENPDYVIHSLPHNPNPEISGFLRNGFSGVIHESVGQSLHALCIKIYHPMGLFSINTLINMYGNFGRIQEAWCLFDQMPERNESTWNTMVSALVRVSLYPDAIWLFSKMRGEGGVGVGEFVTASLLTACTRSGDMVFEGYQVHGLALKNGLCFDVFVGTALLHFYGKYGFHSFAQRIFEELPRKNVVSWTSLMVGYSDNGDHKGVMDIYKRVRREGLSCNQNTLTTVITSCGYLEDEFLSHQVFGHVIKHGFDTNPSVSNSLVSMFGNFGDVQAAQYIFDEMTERDTISWNSMISAYAHNGLSEDSLKCFSSMRHIHEDLDAITFSALLSVCGSMDYPKWGRAVHSLVHKVGLEWDLYVCNTLLTMYSEAGRSDDMEHLFDEMPERDLITWNSLMAGYIQAGEGLDALRILVKLLQIRKGINHVTFASALTACSCEEFVAEAKILHALAFTSGLNGNLIVGNALVTTYGKCGMMRDAEQVFRKMHERNLVTWNALIGGYAECEEPDQAVKIVKLMRMGDVCTNYITVVHVLGSCSLPSHLRRHGMPLHGYIIRSGLESDDYVKNSIITMYSKCNDLESSHYIFNGLLTKSSVTWNAMLAANARHGHGEEALRLFLEMQRVGVHLDEFSFSAALAAAANLAILEDGQQLHSLAIKKGSDFNISVTNAIMDMYGKCGEMNDALKMLPEPRMRSRKSWNVLISAFARQGSFQEARGAFHEMVELGSKPDHVTFVSLLSACSHGGLVDEGLSYFSSMTRDFGVPAGIEHCVCVIDLLGRSGRFSEAEAFIKEMPVTPNDFVWRSLLAACRIHGNSELGRRAARHLLESDPLDDSAYVLYSNVCATSGKWEDVQNLRWEMESNNVKKKPACSWIKLKRKVSSFGIGDRSHPQSRQIYAKLAELRKKVKEAGYVADTSFALHDTDEEQKEHSLWNHSERLALAYGLINTPDGSDLQIFKNIRVCGDCHSVFKFVSNILRRAIVLRDPFRFHHFSGGKCSCGDYW